MRIHTSSICKPSSNVIPEGIFCGNPAKWVKLASIRYGSVCAAGIDRRHCRMVWVAWHGVCWVPAFPDIRHFNCHWLTQWVVCRGTVDNIHLCPKRAIVVNPFGICNGQAYAAMGSCGPKPVILHIRLGSIIPIPVIPYRMEQNPIYDTCAVLPIGWAV